MDKDKYLNYLLSRIPTAKVGSGGRVVNCRCFYCKDGKSFDSRHFGISIPQQDGEPSLYNCFLCHSSGLVTYKKLIEWDIYDDSIAMDLITHNEKISKVKINKYSTDTHYIINSYNTTINEVSEFKLNYFNSRIGTNYSYDDLRKLKIILNLEDLLKDNRITKLTRSENVVNQLNINFLGFLSIDNAFLNMRRLCDKGFVDKSIDKRYINYKLVDTYDTSKRFYTVPTMIDLLSTDRIQIHIAEGPFDIISVYENMRHREPGIYTSIAGSNYKGIIMYFLEKYKLPYTSFHIYPDNDEFGSNENMQKIANFIKPFNSELFIHRNVYPGEKDFGVSPNRIKENIVQLL